MVCKATRDTWAGHGTPARAWYFSTDPDRPIGAGQLVTIERCAGKLYLRDAATGEEYDVLGAAAKLWLADDVVPTAAEIAAASMTARYLEAKLHDYLHWVTSGRSNEPGIALLYSRLSCARAAAAQAGEHALAAALAARLAELQPAYDAYQAAQDDALVLAQARNALSRAAGWDGVPVTDSVRGAAIEEAERAHARRLVLELDEQAAASFRIVRRHAGQLSTVDNSTGTTIGTATRHQNTARTGYFWGVNVNGRSSVEDYKYQAEEQLHRLATAEQRRRMLADRVDVRAAQAVLDEPRQPGVQVRVQRKQLLVRRLRRIGGHGRSTTHPGRMPLKDQRHLSSYSDRRPTDIEPRGEDESASPDRSTPVVVGGNGPYARWHDR